MAIDFKLLLEDRPGTLADLLEPLGNPLSWPFDPAIRRWPWEPLH